ncbi:EAL domain-containing protein [Sphingomicrobium astaxanthinifaciens]|uniref:EAL domain-containing protein n=1 Tax=Sphingomicrobium astaxanthinifaciens TaxID=1227949 RepID=UPI001FCC8EAD|nr:EAL domain-containing protein [Sphingomicrobium astaxanthinifaciens]MCJ7420497.1 EAL domain-containing protein [Sphingomicrobium astaxanthinifaciens]
MRFWARNETTAAGAAGQEGGAPRAAIARPRRGSRDHAAAQRLLRTYEETSVGWFWMTDAEGRLSYLTREVAAQFGEPDAALGAPLFDFFEAADDSDSGSRGLRFTLARKKKFQELTVRARLPGSTRLWSLSGVPQEDAAGRFSGYCGSAIDVTDQVQATRATSRLAMHDPLTGLPNRLRMRHVLEAELEAARATTSRCAVLTIDLDRFKQVNDTLGHPVGDALLVQVADRIVGIVGDKERAFRLGGDEFQIVHRGDCSAATLEALGRRLIASLSQSYSIEGTRCTIGASVGIAIAPDDGQTVEDIVRNADLALYDAKGSGRGRVSFFTRSLLKTAERRRILENDLRDALAAGQIEVHYQPVVSTQSDRMTCVEALIRWPHPEYGYISPAQFIPVAEEANLIVPLGDWVLRKACEDAASWEGEVRVAVNVSPLQFDSSLIAKVTNALAASGLAPERLELEITEGVFLDPSASVDNVFDGLKHIGVRLALDDFGTGYSSLGYLKTAPFDKIKIDQSFVRAATLPGSRNQAIIAAIVALAGALRMETTAEGVETLDQLDLVRNLGVSHVQGYVYSKPLEVEELARRIGTGELTITPKGPSRQRSERVSMYRTVRAIFGNHSRELLIRNLSETGALVEGLDDVPPQSPLIVDFGEGFLAFAKVVRRRNRQQGLEFEERLVSDEAGAYRPAQAVSTYALEAARLPALSPAAALPAPGDYDDDALERYRARLKIPGSAAGAAGAASARAGAAERAGEPRGGDQRAGDPAEKWRRLPAIVDLVSNADEAAYSARDRQLLREHILPAFGHLSPDTISASRIGEWLVAKSREEGLDPALVDRLERLMGQIYLGAIQLGRNGTVGAPAQVVAGGTGRNVHERPLSKEEVARIEEAVEASPNTQLKHVVALLIHSKVRERDILQARWDDIDLAHGTWTIPTAEGSRDRVVPLTAAARRVIDRLPRFEDCSYLMPNPTTRKPYKSLASSWDTARRKAGLPDVEIDDLRFCDEGARAEVAPRPGHIGAAVGRFVEAMRAAE